MRRIVFILLLLPVVIFADGYSDQNFLKAKLYLQQNDTENALLWIVQASGNDSKQKYIYIIQGEILLKKI